MASPNCTVGDTFSLLVTTHEHNIKGAQRNIYKVPVFQSSALLVVIITSMLGRTMAATPQAVMLTNAMPVVSSAVSSSDEQEEIKVIIERSVPVPMRDGTILRADIHRPDRGGPYPVLVQRTVLGKEGNFDRFVKAGYIVVSQDERGLYASEGKYVAVGWDKERIAEDGYDTVEWAAKLPGSNGKVGVFGRSAPAALAWLLASLQPPSLVVMSAESVVANNSQLCPYGINRPYIQIMSRMTRRLPEELRRANRPGVHTRWEGLRLWEQNSEKWVNWLPWLELPDEGINRKNFVRRAMVTKSGLDEGCKHITVPNLDITGWYDFCNADMLLFRSMVYQAKTEVARKGSRIIIGPWSHATPGKQRVGNFDFGLDASLDVDGVRIRWFDYWLKGVQNGVDKDAPVRRFIIGDNAWRDEQYWPLQRTKDKILFVVSNGNANTANGDGKLTQQKPENVGYDKYTYDPKYPVPTLVDPPSLYLFPNDQRPLAEREDILVYQGEPLVDRVEVTGNPVVELYAASSALDTDWFVRLIDVDPDGCARNVSMGVVRARYRNGLDKPEFLKPGEPVKYLIRMNPTSNAFLPGHRIRLDITSSEFPNFDRNHNTAVNQNADATLVVAKQTIYHGGMQATRIILPWVPNATGEEKPAEEQGESVPEKQIYNFHQAAERGDIDQIKLFISKGVDINVKDEEGITPLSFAVEAGKIEVIKYLIDHGADINPDNAWTPLQAAPYSSNIEVVKLLIAKGADINAGGWTALHSAVDAGHRDIAEVLIANGADIDVNDRRGMTPLDYAISENKKDIVELLLTKIADLGSKNDRGLTVLHNMAVGGYPDATELLLSKGAKVDERDDNYEFTALHYAARFGSTQVAEVLIAHGADIRAKDKWDYEPIHWAAYHDRPEIVELLIAKGADVNVKNSLGQTPLELAIPRRNAAAIEVLRKHGAKEPEAAQSATAKPQDAGQQDTAADPNTAEAKETKENGAGGKESRSQSKAR